MLIIKIQNDGTGSDQSANYNYGVYINDRRIANGLIKGHNRSNGWQRLVRCLLNQELLKLKDVFKK
jgi:hypothetical protein